MAHKSVAVLDVRSSEVSVFVGERGVNGTFIFKASRSEAYGGYAAEGFRGDFKGAITRAVSAVEQVVGERIKMLYVGVPAFFTETVAKEQSIGFPKKRKVTQKDKIALLEMGKEELKGYRFMRYSGMLYMTRDDQRVVDPVGIATAGLTGCVSYFYCHEGFCAAVEGALKELRIATKYLPTQFAMASYLISAETRDECALFLDAGARASALSVVLGNGVLAERAFLKGKIDVVRLVAQKLELPDEVAETLLHRANLFAKQEQEFTELQYRDKSYVYSPALLAEAVEEGLDIICEEAEACLAEYDERELDYKPLYVSGEGLFEIRGAYVHIAKRLNRLLEPIAPNLPYYNKPNMSSRVALLNMACSDNGESGFFHRIFNGFGG